MVSLIISESLAEYQSYHPCRGYMDRDIIHHSDSQYRIHRAHKLCLAVVEHNRMSHSSNVFKSIKQSSNAGMESILRERSNPAEVFRAMI